MKKFGSPKTYGAAGKGVVKGGDQKTIAMAGPHSRTERKTGGKKGGKK